MPKIKLMNASCKIKFLEAQDTQYKLTISKYPWLARDWTWLNSKKAIFGANSQSNIFAFTAWFLVIIIDLNSSTIYAHWTLMIRGRILASRNPRQSQNIRDLQAIDRPIIASIQAIPRPPLASSVSSDPFQAFTSN